VRSFFARVSITGHWKTVMASAGVEQDCAKERHEEAVR